jgi:hypothetical protein
MAASEQHPLLEQVGKATARKWPTLVALVGAGFVILALLKPWSPTSAPPDQSQLLDARQEPTAPTAAPVGPDSSLVAALERRQCQSGAGWRLVAMERDALGRARALWDVDELAPSADAALAQAHRLRNQEVLAIGFCAPGASVAARASLVDQVVLWRRHANRQLELVSGSLPTDPPLAGLGEVYLGPPASLSATGNWPSGDYLFEVKPQYGDQSAGWFALRIVGVTPSSLPSPSILPVLPAPIPSRGNAAGTASSGRPLDY